jgi:hypothetical protein
LYDLSLDYYSFFFCKNNLHFFEKIASVEFILYGYN